MKKNIFTIPSVILLLTACTAEEGTFPGSDTTPAVTVYTYSPEDENSNPDNDINVRFSTNSATTEFAYLVEKSDDVNAFIAGINPNGGKEDEAEQAYIDRVLANGTKVSVNGAENIDVTVTDLYGEYVISAVAVGSRDRKFLTFTGLDWEDVTTGTFKYNQSFLSIPAVQCALQICTTDKSLYRIKDAFGAGYPLKFQLLDVNAKDADNDVYTLFRIPLQKTPWKINLSTGGPYPIVVEDIGYWQNNAGYVTDVTGYENGMYSDYFVFFNIAWGADRGGADIGVFSIDYPSYFIPD